MGWEGSCIHKAFQRTRLHSPKSRAETTEADDLGPGLQPLVDIWAFLKGLVRETHFKSPVHCVSRRDRHSQSTHHSPPTCSVPRRLVPITITVSGPLSPTLSGDEDWSSEGVDIHQFLNGEDNNVVLFFFTFTWYALYVCMCLQKH